MWERLGAPKEKIVVGLATYGRTFQLTSAANYGFNAASSGGGKAGEFTKEAGFLAFYEICQLLKDGATYLWDEEQKVPYAIKDDMWVGFDDERSIEEKVSWINQNGYGGGMVWTVDMDDFMGTCSGIKYPLLHVMAHHLYGKAIPAGSQVSKIIQRATAQPLPGANAAANTALAATVTGDSAAGALKPEVGAGVTSSGNATGEDKDFTNARVVCYYTNWSRKRPAAGKFEPSDIDPTLCTHLIYAFAGLKDNKIEPTEETDEEAYKQVLALKEKNPSLRVLLAIGGWMVGPQPFRTLTENVYRQTLFTFSAIEYLRAKGFDGLDLCWEFPRGTEDKARFTALVKVSNFALCFLINSIS
jgi:chitinase